MSRARACAQVVRLRLYVAEGAPNSVRAVANLRRLVDSELSGRAEIELVDVLTEPERALLDKILVTPTLVRLEPLPVRRIVGTLDHVERVLAVLDVGGRS